MLHLVANPAGDVFGRGIEWQYLVQVLMIQLALHQFFDMGEVRHHPVGVQLAGPAMDSDNPVVAMQILALAGVRKPKAMGGRYFQTFDNCIHI